MQKRPLWIKLFALSLFMFPILLLLCDRQDLSSFDILPLTTRVGVFFIFALSMLSGWGIWRGREWGFYGFLALGIFILISDIPMSFDTQNFNLARFLKWIPVCLAFAILFRKTNRQKLIKRVGFEWARAARISVQLNATFNGVQEKVAGRIVNISTGGCLGFLPTAPQNSEIFIIEFLLENQHFLFKAKVTHQKPNAGNVGFQFIKPSFLQTVKLQFCILKYNLWR